MILLRLSGGLGNQMFEYALYVALKARGKTVKIDDVSDYMAADRRSVQLDIFDAPYERASREEIIRYTDASMAFRDRVRRKLTGRKSLLSQRKVCLKKQKSRLLTTKVLRMLSLVPFHLTWIRKKMLAALMQDHF